MAIKREWLPIEGYEGLYEQDRFKQVRSVWKVSHGRVYQGRRIKETDKKVHLLKDGKWRRIRVDQLVRTPALP